MYTFFRLEGRNVVQLRIIGPKEKCDGAETRILLCIVRHFFSL